MRDKDKNIEDTGTLVSNSSPSVLRAQLNMMRYVEKMKTHYLDGAFYFYNKNKWDIIDEPETHFRMWYQRHGCYLNTADLNLIIAKIKAALYEKKPVKQSAYIPYQNGLLNVEEYCKDNQELKPHDGEVFNTYVLPYSYEPEAKCPKFLTFLYDVFEGREEKVRLLQEWMGYCTTHDVSLQKFMLLVGQPRSGKGTLSNIIHAMVGKSNGFGMMAQKLMNSFIYASLIDKNCVFVGELEKAKYDQSLQICQILKDIIGNGEVTVERKGKDVNGVSVVLPCKWTISCNAMPTFPDSSGALAARALVLKFNKTFAGREDFSLGDRLLTELPGINQWALRGLVRLRKQGWTMGEENKKAQHQFSLAGSEVLGFLEDCCIIREDWYSPLLGNTETTDDIDCSVSKSKLKKAYNAWVNREGLKSDYSFHKLYKEDLKAKFPHFDPGYRRRGTGSQHPQYFAEGITLKPEWMSDSDTMSDIFGDF